MLFALCLSAIGPPCARASVREVRIDPANTRISYTVFALGILPITATFEHFAGLVVRNTARPGACYIQVAIDVDSLHMDSPDRRRRALAEDMLDSVHFPTMRFTGTCAENAVVGTLSLHGVTRKFTLTMQRNGPEITCAGNLARGDFGILGMRDLVAPDVRIRLTVRLPP